MRCIHEGVIPMAPTVNIVYISISPHLFPQIWKRVQNFHKNAESFPVELTAKKCQECNAMKRTGIRLDSYFFCERCCYKVWHHVQDSIF
jgi:CRISPR/Cas system-associated exonuclease Cas4 (RecB family)